MRKLSMYLEEFEKMKDISGYFEEQALEYRVYRRYIPEATDRPGTFSNQTVTHAYLFFDR